MKNLGLVILCLVCFVLLWEPAWLIQSLMRFGQFDVVRQYNTNGFGSIVTAMWRNPDAKAIAITTTLSAAIAAGIGVFLLMQTNRQTGARFMTRGEAASADFFGRSGLFFGRFGGIFVPVPWRSFRDPRTGKRKLSRMLVGGRKLFYPSNGHAFVIGPPASGKGASLIIPNMLTWENSAIVLDIRGETFDATAGYRDKVLNSRVYRFAPLSETTDAYNPLEYVRDVPGQREQDITEIAEALIPSQPGEKPYWIQDARQLMSGVISLVLEDARIALKDKNIGTCMDILQSREDPRENLKKITNKAVFSYFTDRQLGSFQTMAKEQFSGVYSNMRVALRPYLNPLILNATSRNTFDLRRFKSHNQTLYIDFRMAQVETIAPLANLLLSQSVKYLGDTMLQPNERPVLMLLDEFSNLGRLQPLLTMFKALGGYGVAVWIFVQSIADLDAAYGRDGRSTLLDSSDLQIFLGASNPVSLRHFEELLGKKIITIQSKTAGAGFSTGASVQSRETMAPLMSTDELRQLSFDKAVILPRGLRPILATRNFFFSDPALLRRSRLVDAGALHIPTLTRRTTGKDDFHVQNVELPDPRPVSDDAASLTGRTA